MTHGQQRAAGTGTDTDTDTAPSAAVPVVYECVECGERQLERRCPDCNLFTRRLGPGGPCPHCDEPVVLTELVQGTQTRA